MAVQLWLVRQNVGMTSHHPHEVAAAALRADIAMGTFPPGEALPGQRELAGRYQVAPNTMGLALRLLETEGLVEMAPRRKTRVLRSLPSLEVRVSDDGHLWPLDSEHLAHSDTRVGARTVNEQAAQALTVASGTRLFTHEAVLLHSGSPWAAQTLFTAAEPGIAGGEHAVTVEPFINGEARQEARHTSRWSARPASAEENRLLRGHSLTVLEIRRVGFLNERPNSYLITLVRADRATVLMGHDN
ncbi:GntR family transcriptional regulator [Streptomyces xiamenensis]|uniref:GntR family transcriptional regulator n=1 Tax=Streptomyces xiamenensis TaxID=408015 RepID=UPI0036E1C319